MDLERALAALAANGDAIGALARDVAPDRARLRPSPGEWSVLEVINHLIDEEREDFRLRLDLTLHHPDRPVPPNDPEGWVTARDYNGRDLAESIARFQAERQRSLAWLRALGEADWSRPANRPDRPPLRAGDLLASWVAHDLLHLRQLVVLKWGHLATGAAPYSADYAGPW
jgi:hypothetical protein